MYLPISRDDLNIRGWSNLDIILVSGDAYVDHPSFGPALLGRYLEANGYKVGIIAQPDWNDLQSFKSLGRPRLFFGVTSGNVDSMVSHFTANRKRRHNDVYSPGGRSGKRPDRALIVYCNKLREAYPGVPLVIGGLEASLRRFAHYDYWTDKVRRSMLMDAKADLLVFGMGEIALKEIAGRLSGGISIEGLHDIKGISYKARISDIDIDASDSVFIGDYEVLSSDKAAYANAFKKIYNEQDPIRGRRLIEGYGQWCVVQNPPARPLSTEELDTVYELPYERKAHPVYDDEGGVPALSEVQFSVVAHRGCFGACSFCSLIMHQGRIIQSRSTTSIIREVTAMTKHPDWKGIVHDVGGPTANFHVRSCEEQLKRGCCSGKECLFPEPCSKLNTDHRGYLDLLEKVRNIPGVKRVFVRSGVRYDYALLDKSERFLTDLCKYYVSGQLKVAPEHVSKRVLKHMRKPSREVYERFVERYRAINKQLGKKQYLVPYMISGHPGCNLEDMIELAEFIRDKSHKPEQVQEFTPTPMTAATCMYYTEIDPFTNEKIFVAKSPDEKRMQRALLQYTLPENRADVEKALMKCGRNDLIGNQKKSLIRNRMKG